MKCALGKRQGRRSTSLGFSLVEAVVGLAVFGVMLITFFIGLYQSLTIVRSARETLRATQIATEKMDTIRLYSWSQLNTPGFVATNFQAKFDPVSANRQGISYTGLVQIADAKFPDGEPYSTNTKQVTLTLRWPSGPTIRQLQMTTYVSRYGLATY
jgi:type II secretory pathway pseudopilin PulG